MELHLTATKSHSVTCHPTQVNTARLNPSHAGCYSIYLPHRDGRRVASLFLLRTMIVVIAHFLHLLGYPATSV